MNFVKDRIKILIENVSFILIIAQLDAFPLDSLSYTSCKTPSYPFSLDVFAAVSLTLTITGRIAGMQLENLKVKF